MNREQRRRASRGKRKTATLAGVSLAAASGLFGAYLGNGRIPKAYAAPVSCTGTSTMTFPVTDDTSWANAVTSINTYNVSNPTKNCFVLDITNSFTVSRDLERTAQIQLTSPTVPLKISIEGNDHTLTGDPGVANVGWLFARLPGGGIDTEVHISDLTVTGMHKVSNGNPAVLNLWPMGGQRLKAFLDNFHAIDNTGFQCWLGITYIYGEVHVSDSSFIGNTKNNPSGCATGGALFVYNFNTGVSNQSTITNSVFEDNSIVSGNLSYGAQGGAVAFRTRSNVSSLTIDSSTFIGNSAVANGSGGSAIGGAVVSNAPVIVRDSVFADNTVTGKGTVQGGGVQVDFYPGFWLGNRGGIKVYDSQFTGNQARETSGTGASSVLGGAIGGGLDDTVGAMVISGSTFSGNSVSSANGSGSGGAIGVAGQLGATASFVNSTFTGNTQSDTGWHTGGGAVYMNNISFGLDFTTVTGNTSSFGAFLFKDSPGDITNSIVNANTSTVAGQLADTFSIDDTTVVTVSYSLYGLGAGVGGAVWTPDPGTVVQTTDPQVAALSDNGGVTAGALGDDTPVLTMLPLPGSQVLNAGTITPVSGVLPANDQRGTGFPRVIGGVTDMGAIQTAAAPPPPPPPVYPPSAPRDVVGVPGDGEVAVSWQAPANAGSFPVTNYQVTAGPGGKSCLATAPALTCTVTGLTNGVPYTFTVAALNGAGWGAAGGPSEPVTPSARSITAVQGPRVSEGDKDRVSLSGSTTGLPPGAVLRPWVRVGDTGEFVPGEATVIVGPDGAFDWSRLVMPGNSVSVYFTYEGMESNRVIWPAATTRSLTLFQGTRAPDGRHDRIRTGGTSVGVPEGSRLTPWIRYGDTGAFKEGVASIVVDARGNFTWTREIRKDKKFVAYVAFEDLESNRVTWQRVR